MPSCLPKAFHVNPNSFNRFLQRSRRCGASIYCRCENCMLTCILWMIQMRVIDEQSIASAGMRWFACQTFVSNLRMKEENRKVKSTESGFLFYFCLCYVFWHYFFWHFFDIIFFESNLIEAFSLVFLLLVLLAALASLVLSCTSCLVLSVLSCRYWSRFFYRGLVSSIS